MSALTDSAAEETGLFGDGNQEREREVREVKVNLESGCTEARILPKPKLQPKFY